MQRASASLVVVSNTKRILMMRRPVNGSFADVWVFPGGAQDTTDDSLEYCALRETFEETGLLINPKTGKSLLMDRKTSFKTALLKFSDFEPVLHPVSEWTTPAIIKQKRFTTQFFLAELNHQPSTSEFQSDDEVTAIEWVNPSECLERFSRGEIKLFPPQFFLLKYLTKYPVEKVTQLLKDRVVKPKPVETFDGGILMDWGQEGRAKLFMDGSSIRGIDWKL